MNPQNETKDLFVCRICEQKLDNLATHLCSEPRMPNVRSYEVLRRLGKGSFGTVFLARKKQTQDLFAIKIVSKSHERKKWIYAERNSLVSVSSPYTVKLYSAFQTRQHVYIVMEYIQGPSFEVLLKKHKCGFPESQAKTYAAQLLVAVKHLHDQDISHRDLKPENILLDEDGNLKLVDFGYSTANASLEQQPDVEEENAACPKRKDLRFTAVGTPLYTPPETILLAAQGYDSKRVDAWAIGIVLFEWLTGRVPFTAKDYAAFKNVIRKYMSEEGPPSLPWPDNGTISEEAKEFVQWLLHPNPQQRPTMEQAKKHPFFADIPWERFENLPNFPKKKNAQKNLIKAKTWTRLLSRRR